LSSLAYARLPGGLILASHAEISWRAEIFSNDRGISFFMYEGYFYEGEWLLNESSILDNFYFFDA